MVVADVAAAREWYHSVMEGGRDAVDGLLRDEMLHSGILVSLMCFLMNAIGRVALRRMLVSSSAFADALTLPNTTSVSALAVQSKHAFALALFTLLHRYVAIAFCIAEAPDQTCRLRVANLSAGATK